MARISSMSEEGHRINLTTERFFRQVGYYLTICSKLRDEAEKGDPKEYVEVPELPKGK